MMSKDDDIRKQIIDSLNDAKFPINSRKELENSIPNRDENWKSGGYELGKDAAVHMLEYQDFPFNNAEEVAHVIIKRTNVESRMM